MLKDKEFNSKGDRVNSRDNGGYTCRTDKDRGTCTNNRTGESVNVSRNNDNSWSIDTSNTGNRNTFGSNYPSNFRDDKDTGGGYSGSLSGGNYSGNGGGSSQYGLDNLKDLPRIASETTFAATCHGSIAVNLIIDHAITRHSQGHGANALASLKTLNLSHNYLSDGHAKILNDGLYGYTLNLQSFNFCNNKIGPIGLDFLVKGSIGMDHLQKGGNDINNMMQGILTLPTTSIVCLNLANNNIGDIGAGILGHALISGKLPATKEIDVSSNQITDSGAQSFAEDLRQGMPTFLQNLKIFGNNLTATGEKALALAVKYSPNEMMAVTLDRIKSSGALDFIKKAFNYYAQEHYENHQAASKAAVAIYGNDDWAHCKKLIADGSRELLSGVIKNSANPLAAQVLQKAPPQVKGFTIGGIF